VKVWTLAVERLRGALKSKLLILLLVISALFALITTCFYGAQLTTEGGVVDPESQVFFARNVSFHLAAFWGMLLSIFLGMMAVSRPIEDGRAAITLSKPTSRLEFVLGQTLGTLLTVGVSVGVLLLISWVLYTIRLKVFDFYIWMGFGVVLLGFLLAAAMVEAVGMFVPRLIAGMFGVVVYLASFPAAFPQLHDILKGEGSLMLANVPWYLRWGAEVYFTFIPPLANVQLRAADLMNGVSFAETEVWSGLLTGFIYVVVALGVTWGVFIKRDL
jgi:ABC-type transport system involved in multi-copper enzyme maturation permease subunit